jgi:hypothetical protein
LISILISIHSNFPTSQSHCFWWHGQVYQTYASSKAYVTANHILPYYLTSTMSYLQSGTMTLN